MEGLVADPLSASDRVLILGGSGWFGRTALEICRGSTTMATASRARERFVTWDLQQVRDFAPTVVLNFAFLTPDHEQTLGTEEFEETNLRLIEQFARSSALPSVRLVLSASSGAVTAIPESAYGRLKILEEKQAEDLRGRGREVVIARAYSMSGQFVRNPNAYALSDFILQARTGTVRVKATRPVWRRYTDVSDFLQVCLRRGMSGWSGTVESGGELVEMSELADRVIQLVNPTARVVREPLESQDPSVYASDDVSWRAACAATDYLPADLDQQIVAMARGLDA